MYTLGAILCGGQLNITEEHKFFQTPDWPDCYPQTNFTCEWTAVDPKSVMIFIMDREVYGINGNYSNNCSDDSIEFFDTSDNSVGKFCSLDLPQEFEVVPIYTGYAKIIFNGTDDPDLDSHDCGRGVRVEYWSVPIIG